MEDYAQNMYFIGEILKYVFGAATALIIKMRRDMNTAHKKLRDHCERLEKIEKVIKELET